MYLAVREALQEPHEYPEAPRMQGPGEPPVQGREDYSSAYHDCYRMGADARSDRFTSLCTSNRKNNALTRSKNQS